MVVFIATRVTYNNERLAPDRYAESFFFEDARTHAYYAARSFYLSFPLTHLSFLPPFLFLFQKSD